MGEEAGGGDIALLFVTEMGIRVPLVSIRRLRFTPEDGGQPAIEFDPPPAFSHPLSRRIGPILASGAQFVPTLQGDESLHVVRAWLIGLNPQLDDEAPATAIREGRFKEVLTAARAFTAGG